MHAYTAISLAYIMDKCKQISNAHVPDRAWDSLVGFFLKKRPEKAERSKLELYVK